MSNATETERKEAEQELKELEQQIEQAAEAQKVTAVQEEPAPSPEPDASPAPVAEKVEEAPVTPQESEVKKTPKDDPLEWAKKKGFKTSEDMARALLQKEKEFHESRQKAEREAATPPQAPQWQPMPQMGGFQPQPGYGFPPPQPRLNPRDLAPYYPTLAPEDVERVMPLILDAADVISNRKIAALEQRWGSQFGQIQRQTERNNELMTLMQDPAFKNEAVQREIHDVLDSNPSLYQRPDAYSEAFKLALANLARKQLQQGVATDTPSYNRPPVTAGGGNGSAFTVPRPITEKEFERWSIKDQEAYLNSNGRIVPKK